MDGYIGFPTFGLFGLLIGFAATAISLLGLLLGYLLRKRSPDTAETLTQAGYVATILSCISLTFCCAILVYCFMIGDISITYVVEYQSDASGSLAWLYRLSGLWAGREGSLLFWAWLISVFDTVVAIRNWGEHGELDSMALFVAQAVLVAFVGVLLFSEDNIPFVAIDEAYVDDDGALTGGATAWGMNSLLEHWAMAIHPPTLFIGYAGLTIPFAYAISALIVNDSSDLWVRRSNGYALFSWLFLTIGIGLGAIWAYVELGWGGFWGWDPVENASLLPWLTCVSLIHSFTVYRQRGIFKRWSVFAACLTFSFVILGTFITRSGIIDSVHAFSGDTVSLVLFLALIIVSLLAGVVGLAIRWKSFASETSEEMETLPGRYVAYYVNNLFTVFAAVLLAYLTLASALPSPLPLAGMSVSTATYEAIARPLGIIYFFLVAFCPLLSWAKKEKKGAFLKRAKVPAICAAVMFVVLVLVFVFYLKPMYETVLASGGTAAEELLDYGPTWYYYALTIAAFLVASLLFFNSLFTACRALKPGFSGIRKRLSVIGGSITHLAFAVLLIGLVGSSMYVTDSTYYLTYDEETGGAAEDAELYDYTLVYENADILMDDNEDDIIYAVNFNVYKDGEALDYISPSITMTSSTLQTTSNAAVISQPYEDLFVVFQGMTEDDELSLEVRVNPLISFVWAGIVLMAVGMALSLFGTHPSRDARAERVAADGVDAYGYADDHEARLAEAEARIAEAEKRAAEAEARAAEAERRASALGGSEDGDSDASDGAASVEADGAGGVDDEAEGAGAVDDIGDVDEDDANCADAGSERDPGGSAADGSGDSADASVERASEVDVDDGSAGDASEGDPEDAAPSDAEGE